ncbi:hypothetical protein [Georgenia sp. SYP-B2076]|uniref:hypothetical protein n=1 Tax=Georgenia sp. SYP-B2076 TaxID=2495881 RepID=UPI000F8D70D5|nr:hypothetical protein [Georgenia sp. SYP-B2076]
MQGRIGGILAGVAGVIAMVLLLAIPSAPCMACTVALDSSDSVLSGQFTAWEPLFYRGAYGSLLALFLFVWFLAYLHGELRRVANSRIYATVALVGGVLFSAGVMLQIMFSLAASTVAAGSGGPIARMVFAVAYNFAFVYAAPVAALVTATSLVIMREQWLPRALGLVGFGAAAVALAWITPGLGAVAGMLWMAVLAAALAVRAARTGPAARNAGAAMRGTGSAVPSTGPDPAASVPRTAKPGSPARSRWGRRG